MQIIINASTLKPAAVRLLAAALAPAGEPLSAPLAALLRTVWNELDRILDAGGVGAFEVDLSTLGDADLHRLAIRSYALAASLDGRRDGPFVAILAQIGTAVALETQRRVLL